MNNCDNQKHLGFPFKTLCCHLNGALLTASPAASTIQMTVASAASLWAVIGSSDFECHCVGWGWKGLHPDSGESWQMLCRLINNDRLRFHCQTAASWTSSTLKGSLATERRPHGSRPPFGNLVRPTSSYKTVSEKMWQQILVNNTWSHWLRVHEHACCTSMRVSTACIKEAVNVCIWATKER